LWQPWATLIAVGAKRVETRSWPPPPDLLGQRIAVHAAKERRELEMAAVPVFTRRLAGAQLPLGAVVATARLVAFAPITPDLAAWIEARDPDERAFGDYTVPGRWAWLLRDVQAVNPPVTFRGRQRIFDVPDELLPTAPLIEDRTPLPDLFGQAGLF
jgi:hypothetical protein